MVLLKIQDQRFTILVTNIVDQMKSYSGHCIFGVFTIGVPVSIPLSDAVKANRRGCSMPHLCARSIRRGIFSILGSSLIKHRKLVAVAFPEQLVKSSNPQLRKSCAIFSCHCDTRLGTWRDVLISATQDLSIRQKFTCGACATAPCGITAVHKMQ